VFFSGIIVVVVEQRRLLVFLRNFWLWLLHEFIRGVVIVVVGEEAAAAIDEREITFGSSSNTPTLQAFIEKKIMGSNGRADGRAIFEFMKQSYSADAVDSCVCAFLPRYPTTNFGFDGFLVFDPFLLGSFARPPVASFQVGGGTGTALR